MGTLIGLILGILSVAIAMIFKEVSFSVLLNPAALLVIFAGTIAAVTVAVPGSELKNVPIILKPNSSKVHTQIAQEYLKHGTKPKIVVESSNVFPMLPLCSAGNAGEFMPHTILRYVREHYSQVLGGVVVLPVQDIAINCDIAIMYLSSRPTPVYFNGFIEITKNVFAEFNPQ